MPKKIPIALTIAGSDSGGGAGIQADLKTFAALGVHGASVITCLTAQNPARVLGIEMCPPEMVRRQLEAVFQELPPAAVKTGMLFSAENIQITAAFLKNKKIPLVVDPIMLSTSGVELLQPRALKILMDQLIPRATLVTPNLAEAQILCGQEIVSIDEMESAARIIHSKFGCSVLLKGGHLHRQRQATDIFFDGKIHLLLRAPFVKGIRTHGTGCVYSAAICAALARGKKPSEAVQSAKRFVTQAILKSYRIGHHFTLGVSQLK